MLRLEEDQYVLADLGAVFGTLREIPEGYTLLFPAAPPFARETVCAIFRDSGLAPGQTHYPLPVELSAKGYLYEEALSIALVVDTVGYLEDHGVEVDLDLFLRGLNHFIAYDGFLPVTEF